MRIQARAEFGRDTFAQQGDAEIAQRTGSGHHHRHHEQTHEACVEQLRIGLPKTAINHEARGSRQSQRRRRRYRQEKQPADDEQALLTQQGQQHAVGVQLSLAGWMAFRHAAGRWGR